MALITRLALNRSGALRQPVSQLKRCFADEGFARLNIYKDVEKRPKEMDDDQYPKWLWGLLEPEPSKEELYREAQSLYTAGGYDAVFEGMSKKKLTRLFRLSARSRIQANNARRKGGRVF